MKDVKQRLAEVCISLSAENVGKLKQFVEDNPKASDEAQLNFAESLSGIQSARESAAPIRMHNGASHNGHAVELRESVVNLLTETVKPDKEKRVKHLVESGRFTEAEAKAFVGQSMRVNRRETVIGITAPSGLSEREAKDYLFFRSSGLSEADSTALAKVKNPVIENGGSLRGI